MFKLVDRFFREGYMPFKAGDIVIATAGRDKNKYFIISGIIDELYVYIADGKSRNVDDPKKKKMKHIKISPGSDKKDILSREIKARINESKLTNSFVRRSIDEYKSSLVQSGQEG